MLNSLPMRLVHAVLGGGAVECEESKPVKAAKATRDSAREALADKEARLERLTDVINASDAAARAASDAARQAHEARQLWVRDGCLANARAHHDLAERASESARVAQSAAQDAAAVEKEMARAQQEVESARSAVRETENGVQAAIGNELLDRFWHRLERREELITELQSVETEVRGFFDFVLGWSGNASRRIEAERARVRLQPISDYAVTPQGSVVSRPPDEVLRLTAEWRARAERLFSDSIS